METFSQESNCVTKLFVCIGHVVWFLNRIRCLGRPPKKCLLARAPCGVDRLDREEMDFRFSADRCREAVNRKRFNTELPLF